MVWVFLFLMVSVSAYVLRFGGTEERVAITTLVSGFVATAVFYRMGTQDWLRPQIGIMAVDAAMLTVFLIIAFRSKRFWPLPIAAFQMIPVLTHFVSAFGENLVSYAMGVTQGVWGYLQLGILLFATKRSRSRQPS